MDFVMPPGEEGLESLGVKPTKVKHQCNQVVDLFVYLFVCFIRA